MYVMIQEFEKLSISHHPLTYYGQIGNPSVSSRRQCKALLNRNLYTLD